MASGVRFIRKGGRVIPIRSKPDMASEKLKTRAVAGVGIAALAVGTTHIVKQVVHENKMMQAFKKAVVANKFGMTGDYQVFKSVARDQAFKSIKAGKMAKIGIAGYAAAAVGLGVLGYSRMKKKAVKNG